MSPAYIRAVRDNIRGVVHVFDHFHVIKLFNDKLSAFRRQLFHQLTAQGQKLLKGTRWLLLKNPERSEEHTSELQSHSDLVCRLLLEKKRVLLKCRNHVHDRLV